MEYRRLGKTNEKVSAIGIGTWRIGNFHSHEERAEQVRALKRGIELGMNLIDTAEVYGSGRSEQLVGEAIKDQRESVFIASKVWSDHLHHDDVIAACKSSLQRLGTDHLDLYQVHWPNPSIPIRETMSAMEQLVRDGLVRHVGVSNFSIEQTDEAQGALTHIELASNQVEYSIAKRSAEEGLLPYLRKEGMTLIAYSPLAKGAVANSHIPRKILERYKMTSAQAMLNWVTRLEGVVAIPKAGRVDHMEENAGSVSVRFADHEYRLMTQPGAPE